MKIVISHSETKRVIDGPFEVCGSKANLMNIANQIIHRCGSDFNYGWININERPYNPLANVQPKGWDD